MDEIQLARDQTSYSKVRLKNFSNKKKQISFRSSVQKLLLVADPQLIGEKDEGFFGLITRNDADR